MPENTEVSISASEREKMAFHMFDSLDKYVKNGWPALTQVSKGNKSFDTAFEGDNMACNCDLFTYITRKSYELVIKCTCIRWN